ncbi:MAG: HAMP domain-containing histidine kinase [Rhodobacteraceae bacterium]|nr:HAMP domain-containing histidine kinase [Paracoccaceae bacterium]MBR9822292.1 HAMP domain-containing histidine kinase [Paracoccaceae bacterium]
MRPRRTSLRTKLAWQLILLQVTGLTLFAVLIALPPLDGRPAAPRLDEEILEDIAESLRDVDGAMVLRPDEDLLRAMQGEPGFWLQVARGDGAALRHGPVPASPGALLGLQVDLTELEIRRSGEDPARDLLAEQRDSPAGRVVILTGGGPRVSAFRDFVGDVSDYYLGLVAILGLLTALVIPLLLMREFRGLARVEAEAGRIDIDRPGTRLSTSGVPAELTGLVQAVNLALARLDEGIGKRKRFLATAAHELRTPITILTMRIEALPPGEDRSRLLLDVSRLTLLANQLLDWQRLESGGHHPHPIDLTEVAREALAEVVPVALAADCTLSLEAPDTPVQVLADAQAVARIVSNLVQNAVAHGGRGTAITVTVDPSGQLGVGDDGPGIAPEDQPHVFDPFFRAPGAGAGSGLGLNLVRDIVLGFGGKVRVTTGPAGGALFLVRFRPAGEEAEKAR